MLCHILLLLHLHYNHCEARGRTPEHLEVAQNVREWLSGLCCQNIPGFVQKALHYETGECGTMAWSSVWGSGGFGAGLAPCRDGMGWEASSGSEGAGEPPSGLHGDVKAQGDGGVLGQKETPKSPCQCWAVAPVPKQAGTLSARARVL